MWITASIGGKSPETPTAAALFLEGAVAPEHNPVTLFISNKPIFANPSTSTRQSPGGAAHHAELGVGYGLPYKQAFSAPAFAPNKRSPGVTPL
jgi:hypothetical protein